MIKGKRKAILIGVTGQIGAGKSTVSKIFRALGCTVISGDELGRQVLEQSIAVRQRLVRAFGNDILLSGGKVNRTILAERAFISKASRNKLNKIIHPSLLKELDRQITTLRKTELIIVIDATLLIEWGYHVKMDEVVVVTASKELRHRRLRARGIAQGDILARERLQLTRGQFREYATKVIPNSGSAGQLKAHATSWLKSLLRGGR